MGSPSLFTRQQALKLGYFYWLRVKNSNPLLTELSLCYMKHTKFYLVHKASFIQISSIASFNSFLIAWLWGYCTFSDSSVVSLKSSPWAKDTNYETISPKKIMFYYQTFFLLQIFSFLDCSYQIPGKKIGGHRACFPTNCYERWTWLWDRTAGWIICLAGLGRDTKYSPSCSKYALEIKFVFGCFYVFDIANTEIPTWKEYIKCQGMR